MTITPPSPVSWPTVALDDFLVFMTSGSRGWAQYYAESGSPFLRIQNVGKNKLLLDDIAFVEPPNTAEAQRTIVQSGDVLLSITADLGRTAVIPPGFGPAFVNQHLAILRLKDIDPFYLSAYLSSPNGQVQILRSNRHGVKSGLNFEDIRSFKIPLPPLSEQRRIADVLDRAEALRAKRRAALAELDGLAQSIFIEMFGDPVINMKNWPLQALGSLGTLDRGISKHRPRNAPELLGGPYPLVQTGDIANCDGYIRNYHSTYSEIGLRQSRLWLSGTLCITIAANIAKSGILLMDACFPDSVVGFVTENRATVEFVRCWLSFVQKRLEESAPESAQKNINLFTLRNLTLPVPPIDLQEMFARRVAAVEKLKAVQRASLAELDALFASLQDRAFRGAL
jgi:type I restriction enzyme S subunit